MRKLRQLDKYRRLNEYGLLFGPLGDDEGGLFMLTSCVTGEPMRVIATVGLGWDHVSVSLEKRCPFWQEMEQVKRMFFKPDEVAMQLHVPETDHVSFAEFCLHLWRPLKGEIPRPRAELVGAPNKANAKFVERLRTIRGKIEGRKVSDA